MITNLFSAIPYIGASIVEWVWGGFSVSGVTLNRFFVLHFLLPILLVVISAMHIMFLHSGGSRNPIGVSRDSDKVSFHWYFSRKDGLAFLFMLFGLGMLRLYEPMLLGEPENFISANPMVTPTHIKPEWYFL